jgi:uncharacterized protein YqgC (DUF456 family)
MGLLQRLHNAFGPIVGGLILDFVDLATFGPVGLILGPFLGGVVGWWIASIYKFSMVGRLVTVVLSAIYCTLPFTAVVPLGTIISATARFLRSDSEEA